MKSLNSICFSFDSQSAVVGGIAGGKCMIAAMPVKITPGGAVIQYIEKEDNNGPTVITRFPGYDYFLVGVGGNVYGYVLEKNLRLKRIQKIPGIATGIISDICIKGNVAYVKGSGEKILNVLVFGSTSSVSNAIPRYSQRVVRHHHVNLKGNLEKVWVDQFNNVIYCGGGLGITGIKKDKLTGQLVQVKAEV